MMRCDVKRFTVLTLVLGAVIAALIVWKRQSSEPYATVHAHVEKKPAERKAAAGL